MITRIEISIDRTDGAVYISTDQQQGDADNLHHKIITQHADAICEELLRWHRDEPDLFEDPQIG